MKSRAPAYVVCFALAAGAHAAILFSSGRVFFKDASYAVSAENTVDVELIEAAPAAEAMPEIAPPVPEPVPPPPVVTPEPPPMPEPPKQERIEPKPETPAATPPPAPKPAKLAPQKSSATHPRAAISSNASTGGAGNAGTNVKPSYLYNPHPPYPEESRRAREQGLVLLSVAINEQGNVISASVRQSSGSARLDAAAREGVRSWRFRPARLAGFPVATTIDVPIRFRLEE